MNDKLSKWTSKQVSPMGRGSYKGVCASDQLITISVGGRQDKNTKEIAPYVRFSFKRSLAKKVGWLAGARLNFEYENGTVVFLRDTSGGYVLSEQKKVSERLYCRFSMPKEYAELFRDKIAVEIEEYVGVVAFVLR